MKTKYDELARLAVAATPGEWRQVDGLPYLHAFLPGQETDRHWEVPCIGRFDYSPRDMRYIAAANPTTIQAMHADLVALAEALNGFLHISNQQTLLAARNALARVKEQ